MAFKLGDRVEETSTAPGLGNFTMNGALQGAQSFASVLTSNGDKCLYSAFNSVSAWENGEITRVSATVYSRATPDSSSNGGALVNFSTGTVAVWMDLPATYAEALRYSAYSALVVSWGANRATNPVWQVNFATASVATGLKVTGAAAASGVALAAISSGTNENLTIDAKGSGTIGIGSLSTGAVTITPPFTTGSTINGATLNNTAWTTYTTTITAQTGTPTTVSATARYKQIGKIGIAEIDATITAVGSAAAALNATLPVNAAAARFAASCFEYAATGKGGSGYINGPGAPTIVQVLDSAGTTFWINGRAVAITVIYETV
jgi:hypothetical protein